MNSNLFRTVLTALIVIMLAGYGFTSWNSHKPNTKSPRQAIFLADGQTYFGYASSLNNKTVTLTDVYFLRPAPTATDTPAGVPVDTTKIDLIKLGVGGPDDIVGSENEMVLNRDAIKYIQVMKDDSQVNQKISDYLKAQN